MSTQGTRGTQAPYGWTVVRRDSVACGFHIYKRSHPADEAHGAADLAPFTHTTHRLAAEAGKRGEYAYKG